MTNRIHIHGIVKVDLDYRNIENQYHKNFDDDYQAAKGRKLIDGKVYLFDNEGHSIHGWGYINGKRYYCNEDGTLVTGWQNIDGKRYFLDPADGGAAHTGVFTRDKAGVMYFDNNGAMADGICELNGCDYLFAHHGDGQNAYATTGWYKDNATKNVYYFDSNGVEVLSCTKSLNRYSCSFDDNGVLKNYKKN